MNDDHDNDPSPFDAGQFDPGQFDEGAGTFEGRAFPSEDEWLELELPASAANLIGADFVAHTVAAVRAPRPEQLQAFTAPEPSTDFVARTFVALQSDRRDRQQHHWRETMARYVAPEPSHEFVARTLRALAADRHEPTAKRRSASTLRTWALPLLAAAAVLAVTFLLPDRASVSIEQRATNAIPAAFGPAHASSPLPALLTVLDHQSDPYAMPNTGGDGIWLLLQENK